MSEAQEGKPKNSTQKIGEGLGGRPREEIRTTMAGDEEITLYGAITEVMEKCLAREGYAPLAGEIAVKLGKYDIAREAMNRCMGNKDYNGAAEIAVALAENDPTSVEQVEEVMNTLLGQNKEHLYTLVGEIAAALAKIKPGPAKGVMDSFLNNERLYHLAVPIAVALAENDPASAIEAMNKLLRQKKEESYTLVGEIAAALAKIKPGPAKGVMDSFLNNERLYHLAVPIAVALAENDPASAIEAMNRFLNEGLYRFAVPIAVALVENDPTSAKKVMNRFLDEGWTVYAAQIAVPLAALYPGFAEEVRKVMNECLTGESYNHVDVGRIAAYLGEYDIAIRAIKKCRIEEDAGEIAAALAADLAAKGPAPSREEAKKVVEEVMFVMYDCLYKELYDLVAKIVAALAKNPAFATQVVRQLRERMIRNLADEDYYRAGQLAAVLAANLTMSPEIAKS